MLSKLLKPRAFPVFYGFPRHSFCQNKDFFQSKRLRQQQKSKAAFKHEGSKLKEININLKGLSPNFFTKTLPMREGEKSLMPNRQGNAVDNSFISMDIPLSTDQEIKNTLVRLTSNEVRIGRMLECMDSMAGIVGYRHCFGSLTSQNPFILVTGSVDSINLFEPIFIDQDITMEGYVNYVGRTSMEIQINLYQNRILKSNALFTMISRNAKDHTKGYPCPALIIQQLSQPELTKAKLRKKQGEANFARRKKEMAESYHLKAPSVEDIAIIHNIFVNSAGRAKESIETEKTVVSNIRLMHMQERNIHNKIFGGFLMREMVETGWVVASRFAGSEEMQIEDITNVYFREPVEIGCHLRVTGRVSYTSGNILIVTMQSFTYTFNSESSQKICCQLQMFFKCKKEQKKVLPRTYENGIYYLVAQNEFKHAFPSIKL